jgi:hypothetical protein
VAERSTGEVYAKLNEPLIPNGRTEDAELRDRVGYDCLDYYGYALGGNAYFDFNTHFYYALATTYEEQLEVPLYIDTWVVMQPTRTTPSYYYPRVRQQIVQVSEWVTLRARWVMLRARWVTLRARWVTLTARWVTLRARRVTLRARWVTLRARWVTLSASWVMLRARWVALRARWVTLRAR